MRTLLLRRARVIGDGRLVDVAVVNGTVSAVGRALDAPHGAAVRDLDGRWVMPGLWDAHVHFTQWARARGSVDVSVARSAAQAAELLLPHADGGALVIGRGFQDATWPDAPVGLTAEALAAGGAPVIAISHDLHSVWLNTEAAALVGARAAGLLREQDAFAAQVALDRLRGNGEADVEAAAGAAAARGVVGVRDLEFADNVAVWQSRVAGGLRILRVDAGIYQEHLADSDARGWDGGSVVPGTDGLVTVGPLKVFSDGALNSQTALTYEAYGSGSASASVGHAAHSPEELATLLTAARDRRLEVALHAIGDLAVTRALDAFAATGARGTIEHAQLVTAQDLPRFARLGIAASVQPQHAIDDRDVADAVWGDRAERAFAYRSLAEAGARLMLGSDAPVAPLDPWVTIAAAISRTGDARPSWHPEQELAREVALRASVRARSHGPWVAPGMTADLIAVDHDPLGATPAALRSMPVALTLVGGRVTYSSS